MAEHNKKGRKTASPLKVKLVTEMVEEMDKFPIVGVVNLKNLPAKQLTNMRAQLRGRITLFMTKKRLIKLAIEKSEKPNIKALEPYLKGMPALLLTDQNPFALYSLLKKKRSNAPIKGGQTAPNDIVVKAGPTSFAPGPVIGELGSFKIKAGIDAGKVVIKEDSIVAKEGDVVSDKLAGLLTRLGIEPMEIGLNLTAVYEKGDVMPGKVLDIDEEAYKKNFQTAAGEAFNLAIFAGIANKDTVEPLIAKAHREARAVAKEAKVMTSDNVGEILLQVEAEAASVKSAANL
ncbi:50S ribosomal protein L10 [Candidatus Woesearchaeota archaeon]|nr:50S ribosomal protein L10 [Candidatus Woesearchaeota archaeon]